MEKVPSLLGEMMKAGFPLVEFKPRTMSMEDVFIQITKGEF